MNECLTQNCHPPNNKTQKEKENVEGIIQETAQEYVPKHKFTDWRGLRVPRTVNENSSKPGISEHWGQQEYTKSQQGERKGSGRGRATHGRPEIRIAADFSKWHNGRQWSDDFNNLREMIPSYEFLYSAKLSIQNWILGNAPSSAVTNPNSVALGEILSASYNPSIIPCLLN